MPTGFHCNGNGEHQNRVWETNGKIYEYTSAANPKMKPIPITGLHAKEHTSGPTRVTSLDGSEAMGIEGGYPASSPNLLASFLRISVGECLTTNASATSQAFYIIHGQGRSQTEYGDIEWKRGDLFVVPASGEKNQCCHFCLNDEEAGSGGAGLYWVSDAPLLSYLGVVPNLKKFEATYFSREQLLENVERVRHEEEAAHRNRLGILLGNKATHLHTKTLTHTLWSLLNVRPAGDMQKPHRHSSVALDLAVYAPPGSYTLMGKEIDSEGNVLNPIRVDWETGAMFVTPAGWWHSHHNESLEDAWVLPMQDAGLYTYQRTLDIRFSTEEIHLLKQKIIR
ncbi:hypothetical protein KI387_003655 [Taxus chinensis]|uniref:Cupin n=1 Tax=Taxus chinensis TaxID=29808 RepID=A0AA38H1M4_TAXCH|nr:hypothetical protein KI387_003655 [Taxus chinensis]